MDVLRWEFCIVCLYSALSIVITGSFYDDMYGPSRCVPNRAPICKKMPYNQTLFPNIVGNENIDEANAILNQFSPLIKVGCSDQLDDFLCLVYIPPCTVTIDHPIPPCRKLCDEVSSACSPLMKEFGFSWPDNLNCDQFQVTSRSDKLCIQSSRSDNSDETSYSPDIGPLVSEPVTKYMRRTTPRSDSFEDETTVSIPEGYPLHMLFLVTSGHRIQILDVTSFQEVDTINAFSGVVAKKAAAVDYYHNSKYIFWASKLENHIYRGTLDLDNLRRIREVVRTNNLEDLVVDWILEVLYWIELHPPMIRTASINGKRVTTVISENIATPTSIAVDPLEGRIFWIDRRWTDYTPDWATLESYNLMTSQRTILLNITQALIPGCGRPRGLAVDVKERRLYWVDARSETLHSVTYEGKDYRLLLKGNHLHEPESVAVYRDHVIWTDVNSDRSTIVQANKRDGGNVMVIKDFDANPLSNLRIFTPEIQPNSGLRYNRMKMKAKWDELTKDSHEDDLEEYEYYDYRSYKDDADDNNDDNSGSGKRNIAISMSVASVCILLLELIVSFVSR